MKRIVIYLVPLILFSNIAYSGNLLEDLKQDKQKRKESIVKLAPRGDKPREHIVDPYREKRIAKKENYYSVCNKKKFKSFYEELDCTKKAGKKFRSDFPDRGTDEYGEKFYAKLSKEQGKRKRDELLKQLDWVSFYPKSENKDIELTVDHLRREITYIERYVMKINPRHYETR